MSDIIRTATFTIDEHRCHECGRWWWLEKGLPGRCPHCAQLKVDEKFHELESAHRTIASLRGALTKAKAKRRAA